MNKSVLMIMGGALVVAILVAMIVQAQFSSKGDKTGTGPTIEILVATKKLLIGERIKPEAVRWQSWPEAALFKGVVKKADQPDLKKLTVYDTPLRRDVESGEPLTTQALIPDVKGGGNFLAASIAPGMRAVAVAVKAQSGVGGFVAPGDRVDVIVSYTPRVGSDAKQVAQQIVQRNASQTVLSNVKVLAVDQLSKDEGRTAKVAKTVTLEVSKEGAEVLVLSEMMGDLSLALRRLGEKDVLAETATPITTDVTTSEVLIKLNSMMNKSRTDSGVVRLYSGSSVQNMPVRQGEK